MKSAESLAPYAFKVAGPMADHGRNLADQNRRSNTLLRWGNVILPGISCWSDQLYTLRNQICCASATIGAF
jgi:hypothetical protein